MARRHGAGGYQGRQIDLLYFTDELWKDAPTDETLKALRETAAPATLQLSAKPALAPADRAQWLQWQVRPLSWEVAAAQPRLFGLSREFWRQQIDAIGKRDYAANVPDYRVPERQVISDDVWNLVANPVQARRRVETLNSDLITTPSPHFSYWLQAGDFQKIEGGWEESGGKLTATYSDFGGTASTDLAVDQPGEYSVWVHFGGPGGYYSPWKATVSNPAGQQVSFAHDQKIQFDGQWQKLGVLKMDRAGQVHFEITPLPFQNPSTYRNIFDFLLTTDPTYVPQGSVRPPTTLAQYASRARVSGSTAKDAYLMWVFQDAYTPLSQEVWDASMWPAPVAKGKTAPPLKQEITMTTNAQRAIQVGLRNLGGKPVTLKVSGGNLKSATRNFPGKVRWRVVGFVPATEAPRDWTPFILMRRASVTIPPRNVAGVWLTVDTTGVAPGNYTSQIVFEGAGLPKRAVALQVRVSSAVAPQKPILIGGWTLPPEGEIYKRDYVKHGMNIWYGEMSKAEMERRGIRQVITGMWGPDEAAIGATIDRFKKLGLDYDDWMFSVLDEPSGATEEALKPYIDTAKAIHKVDPRARVSFNPGEAARLATFQILDPYCDVWLPYTHHRYHHPNEAEAKRAIFTAKPWIWYTTPDLYEESPSYPWGIYQQVRSVPAQPGNIIGTAFFAFYYPFRDAWDTAHEHFPDVGITVMPSRHGPIATRAWEAIGEASGHANLAQVVKEKNGGAAADAATQKLIADGTVAELLAKLAAKP